MSSNRVVLEPRMSKKPPFTVEVAGCPTVDGETIPRRNARSPDLLLSQPEEGISTLFDVVRRGASKFGDLNALGSRSLIKKHNEVKKVKKLFDGQIQEIDKTWTYFEMSGYTYMTFKEYEALILQIGAGFRKLGLVDQDRVHLFASTSAHWLSVAHGAMSQSMAIVTAYDTLGEEGLRHSLIATKAKAIFLEPHLLKTLMISMREAKNIQFIIYNTESDQDIKQEDLDQLKSSFPQISVLSFDELREMGERNPVDPVPPRPEDLCCIMYTSGSSGSPKGVTLKHSNVVAAIAGINTIVGDYLGPGDGLLAYLPLAHIFEFVVENACLYWGSVMGYGNIRRLSRASMRNCKGDIEEFKPTLMIGIPAVWESVTKGVIAQVNNGGPILRTLFWSAFYAKQFLMYNNLPGSGLLDALVFRKVREATGGRMRFCMNGAANIAKDTQEFISMVIAPMINGYGLTETTAMGALCNPTAYTTDAHGEIPSCIEVKLVDFPDAGYFANNDPQQGEIWIRGYSVLARYYQNEEETAAAITPDSWFKTGDIGEWDKHGHLKIIDRKKNLVKTLNGEYIALEKLESVYSSATIVSNICIYASITETNPIAIVFPAEPALKTSQQELELKDMELEDLVHNEKIQQEVLKEMQTVGKRAGLASMMIIQGVVLADEEWTPQNKLVTATRKLNRRGLFEKFQKEIDTVYKNNKA